MRKLYAVAYDFAGPRNSYLGQSWPERRDPPHLARIRRLHAYSDRVAIGEEAEAWRGPGGPSPAERGGRVCSKKSEHRKLLRRRSGASDRAR